MNTPEGAQVGDCILTTTATIVIVSIACFGIVVVMSVVLQLQTANFGTMSATEPMPCF